MPGIQPPPDRGQQLAAELGPAGDDALGIVQNLRRQMGLNVSASFADLVLDWTIEGEAIAVTVSWHGTRRLTVDATRPGAPFLIPYDSAPRVAWIAALAAARHATRNGLEGVICPPRVTH